MLLAIEHVCTGCGRRFNGHPDRMYCTPRCRRAAKARRAYKPRPRGTRLCVLCKAPHHANNLCQQHDREMNGRVYTAEQENIVGICSVCGARWTKHRKSTTTLCHRCVIAARGQFTPNWASMDRRGRARARALGCESEEIDILTLFEQSDWTCALCRGNVDRTLMWPNPNSPSLDHRIPLIRGGGHVQQNAQLAHLRCNIVKGAHLMA